MLSLNTRHMCSCVQCLFGNSLDIKEGSPMFIERGEGGCHEAELAESVFSVISLSHVCFLLKSCKVDYLRMTVQVDVVLCILASPNDALIMIHISEKSNMLVCSLPTQHHPWISMVRFLWSRKKQMPKLLVTWLLSGNQR